MIGSAESILLTYYLIANVITVAMFILDKYSATQGFGRIPEKSLFWIILLSGGVGAFITMQIIRHKTRKPTFQLTAILSALVHILLLTVVLY